MQSDDVLCGSKEKMVQQIFIGRDGSARTPVDPRPAAVELLNGLEQMKAQDARIYRTFLHHGFVCVVFTTTSEDIHLGLGRFTEAMLANLATLLAWEIEHDNNNQVLLVFSLEGGDRSNVLCSIAKDKTQITVMMSPAR